MPKTSHLSGLPDINYVEEHQLTRPMALCERPRQVQIDHEMAVIRAQHERIAKAIEVFWGHKECIEYLKQLILSGGDSSGRARIGFKQEVLSALINLISLHEIRQE